MPSTDFPNPPTIAQQWHVFLACAIPASASKVQVKEMRRAFYCGYQEAIRTMSGPVAGMPEAQAVRTMEGLMAECRQFALDVQAGRA